MHFGGQCSRIVFNFHSETWGILYKTSGHLHSVLGAQRHSFLYQNNIYSSVITLFPHSSNHGRPGVGQRGPAARPFCSLCSGMQEQPSTGPWLQEPVRGAVWLTEYKARWGQVAWSLAKLMSFFLWDCVCGFHSGPTSPARVERGRKGKSSG